MHNYFVQTLWSESDDDINISNSIVRLQGLVLGMFWIMINVETLFFCSVDHSNEFLSVAYCGWGVGWKLRHSRPLALLCGLSCLGWWCYLSEMCCRAYWTINRSKCGPAAKLTYWGLLECRFCYAWKDGSGYGLGTTKVHNWGLNLARCIA